METSARPTKPSLKSDVTSSLCCEKAVARKKNFSDKMAKRNFWKPDFWKVIRRLKKKPNEEQSMRNKNGEIVEEKRQILECKAEYYEELYSKRTQSREEKEKEGNLCKILEEETKTHAGLGNRHGEYVRDMNKQITEKEVTRAIMSTKNKKAPGPRPQALMGS